MGLRAFDAQSDLNLPDHPVHEQAIDYADTTLGAVRGIVCAVSSALARMHVMAQKFRCIAIDRLLPITASGEQRFMQAHLVCAARWPAMANAATARAPRG